MANEGNAQPGPKAVASIPVFRGNATRDALAVTSWVELVSRLQKTEGWTDEITALQAVGYLREEADTWRRNVESTTGREGTTRLWSTMSKALLERFSAVKSLTLTVKTLATLIQAKGESVRSFADRVGLGVTALAEGARAAAGNTEEAKAAVAKFEGDAKLAWFINGATASVKAHVELSVDLEKASFEDVVKAGAKAETVMKAKTMSGGQIGSVEGAETDTMSPQVKKELAELRQLLKSSLKTRPEEKEVGSVTGKSTMRRGPRLASIPMGQRKRPLICHKCRQWGFHLASECIRTEEEIKTMMPQTMSDKPDPGVPFVDPSFPNL